MSLNAESRERISGRRDRVDTGVRRASASDVDARWTR